ncbi:MAG: hypothetical protein Q7U04_13205 [Bacteriovorax sp.]|nr:hypothetical protein [Bacteriovorax sp.]
MKFRILTSMLAITMSLSVSAKVINSDLKVKGVFRNLDESAIKLPSGAVNLFDQADYGLFKLRSRSFILKGQDGSEVFALNKEVINNDYTYSVRSYSEPKEFAPFSLVSNAQHLKLNFKRVLSENSEEYKYTIIPERCEDICVESYKKCRFGQKVNEDGTCGESNGIPTTICTNKETKCIPSYEICYKNSESKATLVIDFLNLTTGVLAGQFISEEATHQSQEKAPMAKCFE